ncbi:GntR family transcriptional regulator [Pseudomonas cuatrocienegasensis]|uniref:GntR family transcriptional regulator n=1 Tax=Pseudomonas cuatrocienegasensis TaxID=543360 RepID=A0ABY1B5X9_9PSED|nr:MULTISPECIES: GntR family transcriptional regulator [Pseudomonas]OEC36664.1 GntR family transcriptional regulator [Pseudomonas sp. 21C1]SEQ02587.1 GntR family transcriptional regulator [Pseudomonas cuatrocienegasensis]
MNPEALYIEPASPDPIYRQIVGQIARMIAAGQCQPGTRLPSVREVAAAHAINPMTVSKAYSLLEEQGLLERLRGKGMVVMAQAAVRQPRAERLQVLTPLLAELVRQARQLDLDFKQVTEALRPLMEKKE